MELKNKTPATNSFLWNLDKAEHNLLLFPFVKVQLIKGGDLWTQVLHFLCWFRLWLLIHFLGRKTNLLSDQKNIIYVLLQISNLSWINKLIYPVWYKVRKDVAKSSQNIFMWRGLILQSVVHTQFLLTPINESWQCCSLFRFGLQRCNV